MLARLAATLLVLVLLCTTGLARATSYLCRMDGRVHPTCCCKSKSKVERKKSGAQVKPERRCCELRVLDSAPASAKPESLDRDTHPLPFSSLIPEIVEPPPRATKAVVLLPGARGPPAKTGPPLFVLNCAYLI